MRTVSDCLHNAGGCTEYTTKDGKVLKIKFLDLKSMSEYEHRLQNKAIKSLAAQKDVVPADLWANMFSQLMDKITAGEYAFGGEIASKTLNTINGVTELISILCSITQDEALKIVLEEKEGFRTVFDSVIKQSVSSPDDENDGESTGEKKS